MTDTQTLKSEVASEAERLVLDSVDDQEAIDLLKALIASRTENPPGREAPAVDVLKRFFDQHGIDYVVDDIAPGRPNLTASYGDPDGPTLVLNGHTDTVPVGDGWKADPFGAHEDEGRIYGRGACDMKCGLTSIVMALATLKRSGLALNGRIVLQAVIDEEVNSLGSKDAVERAQPDWVIVAEPTAGQVLSHGMGQLNFDIEFLGKAAHSSVPHRGRNAIHDAAAFIALVEQETERMSSLNYPGIGPATYSVGMVSGGLSGSIVPDSCTLTLDRRVLPSETLDDAEAGVQALIDRIGEQRPGLQATLKRTLAFPPVPVPEDKTLTEVVLSAVRDLGGPEPTGEGMRGATDAAWYAGKGYSVVVCGPSDGATAHQVDEYVNVSDLLWGVRMITLAATRLLTPDPSRESQRSVSR